MADHEVDGQHEPVHATGGARKKIWSRALICAGVALLPWSVYLLNSLPQTTVVSGWQIAWSGLDAMEAAALAGTGALLARGDDRYRLCAVAAATLLLADAWFDVVTATGAHGQAVAMAMAAGAELPTAFCCAALAVRNHPAADGTAKRGTARPSGDGGRVPAREHFSIPGYRRPGNAGGNGAAVRGAVAVR